jgi:acetoacetyl-CoA reductase
MANRVALVTGGNGGIGTEICKQLSTAGYRVVTTCMDPEREKPAEWRAAREREGYDIGWVQCDVADVDACRAMAQAVEAGYGPVEVLVNCAGITRDGFLHKMEKSSWDAVIGVNLNGVFNVSRQFIDGMRRRGFGRIVNISSVNGQTGQLGQTNYAAAKAGMHGFTMALAKEGARKNVTANTIAPGYIATEMTAAIPEDVRQRIVDSIPSGRMGLPRDVARVVVFLAADDADYINGALIPVNGALFCSF